MKLKRIKFKLNLLKLKYFNYWKIIIPSYFN